MKSRLLNGFFQSLVVDRLVHLFVKDGADAGGDGVDVAVFFGGDRVNFLEVEARIGQTLNGWKLEGC
jgi:hypothetical protein